MTETEITETITIPEGVTVSIENKTVHVKGDKGELSKTLAHPRITLQCKDKAVIISCTDSPKRKEKALIGTFRAHINNMILGVTNGFEYTMKTVYAHFPIKTSVDGNSFIIQNFLGERSPRTAKIIDGVTVETKGDDVTVSGIDKEKVGQTVANIERATKVKKRDIRVFQDGVYLTSKGG